MELAFIWCCSGKLILNENLNDWIDVVSAIIGKFGLNIQKVF